MGKNRLRWFSMRRGNTEVTQEVAMELNVEVKRGRQTKKEMDRQNDTLAGVS